MIWYFVLGGEIFIRCFEGGIIRYNGGRVVFVGNLCLRFFIRLDFELSFFYLNKLKLFVMVCLRYIGKLYDGFSKVGFYC